MTKFAIIFLCFSMLAGIVMPETKAPKRYGDSPLIPYLNKEKKPQAEYKNQIKPDEEKRFKQYDRSGRIIMPKQRKY